MQRPHSLKWIYILGKDHEWQSPYDFGPNTLTFADRKGIPRLELLPGGRIRVLKNYAWDGYLYYKGFPTKVKSEYRDGFSLPYS
ncbi:MAG: hypothetical protein NTV11_07035 [Rhodocyclales bacterium]|nr:hypothetical protein [Rhodocyclales bacterium]